MVYYMTNELNELDSGSTPIFRVIAQSIEASILDGSLPEGAQVPSTNELAVYHRINPATAAKGVSQLATDGTIFKRRGIGMFVAAGARARLLARREQRFVDRFVAPLAAEADLLGLPAARVLALVGEHLTAPTKETAWTPSTSPA